MRDGSRIDRGDRTDEDMGDGLGAMDGSWDVGRVMGGDRARRWDARAGELCGAESGLDQGKGREMRGVPGWDGMALSIRYERGGGTQGPTNDAARGCAVLALGPSA